MELVSTIGNSEQIFATELSTLSDSGAAVIHVRTNEPVRAIDTLRRTVLTSSDIYYEWDVINGMRQYDLTNMHTGGGEADGVTNFNEALRRPMQKRAEFSTITDATIYFIFRSPQHWLGDNNPIALHLLQDYASSLPTSNMRVILLTPEFSLPESVSEGIMMVRLNPPSHKELMVYLDDVLDGVSVEEEEDYLTLSDDDKVKICQSAAGLTKIDFETHVSVSIVNREENDTSPLVNSILAGIGLSLIHI